MSGGFDWIAKAMQEGGAGADEDARAALEQNEAAMKAAAEAQIERAMMVHNVLCTGRGPELLDMLRAFTIDLPNAVDPQATIEPPGIGLNPAEWLFIREGQNSVTRFLEGMIRLARQAATTPAVVPAQPTEGNGNV